MLHTCCTPYCVTYCTYDLAQAEKNVTIVRVRDDKRAHVAKMGLMGKSMRQLCRQVASRDWPEVSHTQNPAAASTQTLLLLLFRLVVVVVVVFLGVCVGGGV